MSGLTRLLPLCLAVLLLLPACGNRWQASTRNRGEYHVVTTLEGEQYVTVQRPVANGEKRVYVFTDLNGRQVVVPVDEVRRIRSYGNEEAPGRAQW